MRWSEKSNFNTCPFKYKMQKDGWRKVDTADNQNDLLWGQAGHVGLEEYYKNPNDTRHAIAACLQHFGEGSGESLVKTPECLKFALEAYFDYYFNDFNQWEILGTEVEGSLEDQEDLLHIDIVAKQKATGSIYFWDHKFTEKKLNPWFWSQFNISDQLTRYTYWVKKEYGDCAGAIINAISVGYVKPYEKGKSNNTYYESLKQPATAYQREVKKHSNYHGKEMTIVSGYSVDFKREIFNRTPDQIEFWKKSDYNWKRLIYFADVEDVYPCHFSKLCDWCEFQELCLSGNNEQVREIMYVKGE